MRWLKDVAVSLGLVGKRHLPLKVKEGSHRALIIEALASGEWVGGYQANIITKSHSGVCRLKEVRRMLKRAGIPFVALWHRSPGGSMYRAIQIVPGFNEVARNLIVGKGA